MITNNTSTHTTEKGDDFICTTIGFAHNLGQVFGRTLELGIVLDNKILYVPKGSEFIETIDSKIASKYNVLGAGFFDIASFGDGINEAGLMGSSNFFPGYASFAKAPEEGKINTTTPNAFDYLLSVCKNVEEVKKEAQNILLIEKIGDEESSANHFFFMDKEGNKVVLEPENGKLLTYDNPYGVLTNAPQFPWHTTNLKNYINLDPENTGTGIFNDTAVKQLGEGTGMLGLPGDFTPPSRFIRAAYYVSNTKKDMKRNDAILQGFRILSQFDIPEGAILDPVEKHTDETLYTSIMDTEKQGYHIKAHTNINLQSYYLSDFKDKKEITFVELNKSMDL